MDSYLGSNEPSSIHRIIYHSIELPFISTMARVAFLVGIRDYGTGLESLPASTRDVEAISAVLKQQEPDVFRTITSITDQSQSSCVSRTDLEESLEKWFRACNSDDVAFLYLSGHLIWDAQEDEVFIATSGSRYENNSLIRSSAVSSHSIQRGLRHSCAKCHVIILDCCLQYADPMPATPSCSMFDSARYFGGDRTVILISSDNFQYSVGQKHDRLSIYTQFLVEGLVTGLADGDRDGDISIYELHTYTSEKVQIATPAIQPKLITSSDNFIAIPVATVQIPDTHHQYYNEVNRSIQRHGIEGSPISNQTLQISQQTLGLSDELAQVLRQTVLSPYQSQRASLDNYREIASKFVEAGPASQVDISTRREITSQLEIARHRLGLTQEMVEPIHQELHYLGELSNFEQYRHALFHALKQRQPISEETRQDLTDLCRILNISKQDERLLSHEVEAYLKVHQQKLEQYRVKFLQAVKSGVVQNLLIREELDNFRQSLGLSNQDIDPLEKQVQDAMKGSFNPPNLPDHGFDRPNIENPLIFNDNSSINHKIQENNVANQDINHIYESSEQTGTDMSDHNLETRGADDDYSEGLREFKRAFINAANRHLPITLEDQQALEELRKKFNLTNNQIKPFIVDALQTFTEQETLYQKHVSDYEAAYQKAVEQGGFPLSDEEKENIFKLERELQIRAHDVRQIEHTLQTKWESKNTAKLLQETENDSANTNDISIGQGTISSPPLPETQLESEFIPTEHNDSLLKNSEQVIASSLAAGRTVLNPMDLNNSIASATNGNQFNASLIDASQVDASYSQILTPGSNAIPQPNNLQQSQLNTLPFNPATLPPNYRPLQRLAHEHKWEEADSETFELLRKSVNPASVGRRRVDWIDLTTIAHFMPADLKVIDQIWSYYSNGKFGFSAQWRILVDVVRGTKSPSDYAINFGRHVGWVLWNREMMGFKYYNQLNFDEKSALQGHLPAKWFWDIPWWESVRRGGLGTGRAGCGDDGEVLYQFMDKFEPLESSTH